MLTQKKKVLIIVKAYPNPSKKYGETVCCAGIEVNTNKWIRLYPIPFRDLDRSQKFKKYNIIEVRCWKANDDSRVESYKVDSESIRILDHLDTGRKRRWEERKKIVLPTVPHSFCSIREDVASKKSLGMFKPREVEFSWKKTTLQNEAKREACYAQLSFFDKKKKAIEQIPFDFYYHFKCDISPECPGHVLSIADWELGQAYRDWRHKYSAKDILLDKIKERWLTRICSPKNDVYFFVGNMKRFQEQFMVLGVFYPPK